MKLVLRLTFLFLLALPWAAPLAAQDAAVGTTPDTDPVPPGSTVITSDELRSDENTHISVFTGNVTVVGTGFSMTCDEMTVYFTKASKVDSIVSLGNVVIIQPGRTTRCGKCQYFSADDKFVLTDHPSIIDTKEQVSAPQITIFRTDQRMITNGRSKVILQNGTGLAPKSSPAPVANP